jgi:hypothetical protein
LSDATAVVHRVIPDLRMNTVCVEFNDRFSRRQMRRVCRRLMHSKLLTSVARVQEYIIVKLKDGAPLDQVREVIDAAVETVLTMVTPLTPRRQLVLTVETPSTTRSRKVNRRRRESVYFNVSPQQRRAGRSTT